MDDSLKPPRFTREQKLKAVAREIALRRNVYPKKVRDGKMTSTEAERELAVMTEIAKDYGGHG